MRRSLMLGILASLPACVDVPVAPPAAPPPATLPQTASDPRLAQADAQEAQARQLLDVGALDQAAAAALASLQDHQASQGALHADTARALELVVAILLEKTDLAGAERIVREQIAAIEAQGGALHAALDGPLVALATLANPREPDVAEAAWTRILQVREAKGSPSSPEVAAALLALGALRAGACRGAEAEPLFTRAFAIAAGHGDLEQQLRALDQLAGTRWNAMDDAGAKARAEQAIALGTAHEAESKGLVRRPLGRLASMFEALGNFAAARPLRERQLAVAERWAALDRDAVTEAAIALARNCFAMGDEAAGQLAYARAHVIGRGRASAPRVDPAARRCTPPGSRSGGNVTDAAQVVAGLSASFRRCYNAGLRENPSMHGATRLTARIAAGGEVTSASASPGALTDEVTGCLLDVVMKASFRPPEGGEATIVIPLTFVSQ